MITSVSLKLTFSFFGQKQFLARQFSRKNKDIRKDMEDKVKATSSTAKADRSKSDIKISESITTACKRKRPRPVGAPQGGSKQQLVICI